MGRSDKKKASKRRRSEEKSKKHSKKRKREKERGRDGDKRKKSGGQDCHRDNVATSDSGSSQVASPPRPSRNPIDSRTPPTSPKKPNHPSSHPSNHPSVAIGPQFPPSSSAAEFSNRPPPAAEIGPQFPPPEDSNGVAAMPNSPPRVARGPQRPPQSILDAAQVLQEEPMVGPLPPDIQEEAEYFSDDVRSKEVDRVMGVAGNSEGEFVDAFKVLGVEEGAGDSEVKKKYWRLSLMVHPDKCPHPKAQQAFQAVNAAFKKLGSAAGRASVRSEKEDAQLRQQAQEEAEQMLRQQQWDVVRSGGALADMKKAGPPTRETWMTELPPERQKPKIASQVSVTSFSQRGIQSRGDTSAWTSTPTQSQKPTIAYKTSAKSIESGGGQNAPGSGGGVAGGGGIVRKSLVEMHLEKLKKEKKLKKKQRKEEEKKGGVGGFKGWRPFDREKDLQIPRDNAKSLDQVMKDAQSLSRRFG
ncbi:hypothetical protein BSKO_11037 [Bryopsis sp. KO-2023]|nr:hypothetical protein BSKO_11037 [Bryopsis sp. KO-2023]